MSESANAPLAADDLTQRVVELIAETQEIPIESILLDAPFEEIGLTSLNALSIVFELENAFGIEVQEEDATRITNVRQAIDMLRRLISLRDQESSATLN